MANSDLLVLHAPDAGGEIRLQTVEWDGSARVRVDVAHPDAGLSAAADLDPASILRAIEWLQRHAGDERARQVSSRMQFEARLRELNPDIDISTDGAVAVSGHGAYTALGGYLEVGTIPVKVESDAAGFHVIEEESKPVDDALLGLAAEQLDQAVLERAQRIAEMTGGYDGMVVRYGPLRVKEWVEPDGWYRHLMGRFELWVAAPDTSGSLSASSRES